MAPGPARDAAPPPNSFQTPAPALAVSLARPPPPDATRTGAASSDERPPPASLLFE